MALPALINMADTARRIGAARRLVLTTHARADGDAIGSVLGLARVLRQRGHQVQALLHEPVADRYAFLKAGEPLAVWSPATAAAVLADADLLLIVDTCSARQLGDVAEAIRAAGLPRLAIDHHVTRDDIVEAAHVVEDAGACAQILLALCDSAGWTIDPTSATLLFAGLATDTGWFRFSNADAAVFTAAARLIERGARPNELYERLYLCEVLPRARLMGAIMSGFELLAEGRLAVCRLPRDTLARCGATPAMTEDLINEPQRLASVVACAMFVEPMGEGPIRVSLRSKRDVNVAAVAARFGGGGHERAAGARVEGSLDDVVRQVTAAMLEKM